MSKGKVLREAAMACAQGCRGKCTMPPYGPGQTMAQLWHNYGKSMVPPWHNYGTTMAPPWHNYGTTMAQLWHLMALGKLNLCSPG